MAFSTLLLVWSAICCLVAADDSFAISVQRNQDQGNLGKRQTGDVHGKLQNLYWHSHWTVGATQSFRLLIDTGSSDLILPKGRYQPYHEVRFEGHPNFSIKYEGVNRAGFGFEENNGTVRRDRVAYGNLSVATQAIGELSSVKFYDVPTPKHLNLSAGHGIIGFLGRNSSSFVPPARGWFHHLCYDKSISECRFGMAFGTNGTGQIVIGKLAENLIDGPLTPARVIQGYTVYGDVVINGETMFENQQLIMDVGTDNLQDPFSQTKQIFEKLGFQYTVKTGKNLFYPSEPVRNIYGTFSCNKPPSVGFAFPAKKQLKEGQSQRVFNVSTSTGVWDVYKNKEPNNCTSILGGTNGLTSPTNGINYWLVGQPFFQGHYIDFDVESGFVNYGDLVNPETGT